MKGLSQNYQNNLREIVKKEIANYTSNKNNSESIVKNLIQEELIQVEVPEKIVEQSTNQIENETEIFELMPELSLDDIDIMVTKQEEEEEMERLEQEKLERQENERIQKIKEDKERLDREHLEKEKLNKERLEKEKLNKERLEKERLTKNVIMDNEVNKKSKQDMKNSEIMVEKQEPTVGYITPIEINERNLYAADLNFDEEINLLDDDISFDPPKKTTSIQSSESKYTFFN